MSIYQFHNRFKQTFISYATTHISFINVITIPTIFEDTRKGSGYADIHVTGDSGSTKTSKGRSQLPWSWNFKLISSHRRIFQVLGMLEAVRFQRCASSDIGRKSSNSKTGGAFSRFSKKLNLNAGMCCFLGTSWLYTDLNWAILGFCGRYNSNSISISLHRYLFYQTLQGALIHSRYWGFEIHFVNLKGVLIYLFVYNL